MENKYKSLTIFEFQERFPNDEACLEYLAKLKWENGFECPHCRHKNHCRSTRTYDRQCTNCNRIVYPTSGFLFHQLKFSVLKAFNIVYYISTNKKGISSTELSRKLDLCQKTYWAFKQKVMRAMKSSGNHKIEGKAEVDETVIGKQKEHIKKHKNYKKKLVVFAIRKKGKEISRLYGKFIRQSSSKELDGFLDAVLGKQAQIKTNLWRGFRPLKKDFVNLGQVEYGVKRGNFPALHRNVMGFKGSLWRMRHQVERLQTYIDEYCYRFNRNFMNEGIFENLLLRMMEAEPVTYNNLSIKCLIQ